MVKVLIVDDHELYREGLKDLLSGNPDIMVTGEASNGQEALSMIAENDYRVVLLDITMPGIDGIEVLEKLKDSESKVKVLMLSIQSEEHYLVRAFKAGASGYLTKNRAPRELISAIKTVSSGGKYLSPNRDRK
ncbi:MAG: response regulator transcription factor [Candidatus Marinimicrobia bacterium]|nr:response regulator transcription factor [Candidatus Neomarinimicrobiota bacterium]MBL7046634.1 response regulator transcription factor [Candidatus Neomarinimicrobiota bacterium]